MIMIWAEPTFYPFKVSLSDQCLSLPPPPPPPQSIQEIYTDFFISQWKKTICLFTFLFPWNQKLRPLVWHNKQNNKVNPTWDTTIVKAACYTYSYFWRKTQVKNIFLTNKNDKIQWQSRHSSFNKNRILHSHFFPSDQGDLKYIYTVHALKNMKEYTKSSGRWGVGILTVGLKQEWVSKMKFVLIIFANIITKISIILSLKAWGASNSTSHC